MGSRESDLTIRDEFHDFEMMNPHAKKNASIDMIIYAIVGFKASQGDDGEAGRPTLPRTALVGLGERLWWGEHHGGVSGQSTRSVSPMPRPDCA